MGHEKPFGNTYFVVDKRYFTSYVFGMENTEIAKIRRWFGFDLKEMGARIGAHYSTVSLLEAGKRKPTPGQLKALESLRKKARAEMVRELAN